MQCGGTLSKGADFLLLNEGGGASEQVKTRVPVCHGNKEENANPALEPREGFLEEKAAMLNAE